MRLNHFLQPTIHSDRRYSCRKLTQKNKHPRIFKSNVVIGANCSNYLIESKECKAGSHNTKIYHLNEKSAYCLQVGALQSSSKTKTWTTPYESVTRV